MSDIDSDQLFTLKTQLDTQEKISQLKDEQIQSLKKQNESLKSQVIELSKSPMDEIDQIESPIFTYYNEILKNTEAENIELKKRLLHALSENHNLREKFEKDHLNIVPMSPKSPSSPEIEIKNLKNEIIKLKGEIEFNKEQIELSNELNQNLQNKFNESKEKIDKMRKEAKEKFIILKKKLKEARDGNTKAEVDEKDNNNDKKIEDINNNDVVIKLKEEVENLKKEKDVVDSQNKDLQVKINDFQNSFQNIQNLQLEFISSLGTIIGCSPNLTEIVSKVKELSELPNQIDELKRKIVNNENKPLQNTDTEKNNSENKTNEVISAFKQVLANLSPNELQLPHDSELRQLFAALCNMFNAALNPNVNINLLNSHIKSVVYQARVFMPNKEENHINVSDVKDVPLQIQAPEPKSSK